MPSIKALSSRDNPLLTRLRKLIADPAAYRKLGELWIEGDHLCRAFVARGGVVAQAVITEEAWQQPVLRELAEAAEHVAVLPEDLMPALSTLESPAPIAFAVRWSGCGEVRPGQSAVVLDRLQDAGNVGAIVRSAAAFGVAQVIALKGTAALWSPKVLRAGMGAHFSVHLVEATGDEALASLGIPLLATSSHAALALHQVTLPWPCAWVMGHEGQGLSASLMQRCAQTLRIAQPGGEESLNVAAAAAVCFYESVRQRG